MRQQSCTKGGDRHESAKAHEVADANESGEAARRLAQEGAARRLVVRGWPDGQVND